MGKIKSFVKSIEITHAKRKHFCKHNKKHIVNAGDKQLTLKVNRSHENFCVECAKVSLRADIAKLQSILYEFENGEES
jgi:hypothetical protein